MCFQNACRDLIDDLGYSGDFGWPMDEAIQVDQLVLDSTNGSSSVGRGLAISTPPAEKFRIWQEPSRRPALQKAVPATSNRELSRQSSKPLTQGLSVLNPPPIAARTPRGSRAPGKGSPVRPLTLGKGEWTSDA